MKIQQETFELEMKIQTISEALNFLWQIAGVICVKPTAFNAVLYPTIGGEGGCGITATLYFVESYCIIDSWPETSFVHLNIVSCKPFSRSLVEEKIKPFLEGR